MRNRDSAGEINDFVRYWKSRGKFDRMSALVLIFPVTVTFRFRDTSKSIEAKVQLHWERHRIELEPTGWLDPDVVYIGFDPQYQTFAFERDHALHIRGTGPKVGGAYHLDILPT